MVHVPAPYERGEAHVSDIDTWLFVAQSQQLFDLLLQLLGRSRRQHNQECRFGCVLSGNYRRLFENQVRIGAAETERADSSTPDSTVFDIPIFYLRVDVEGALRKLNGGIGRLKVQRWR